MSFKPKWTERGTTKEDTIVEKHIVKKPDRNLLSGMSTSHGASGRMSHEQLKQKWNFLPRHINATFTDGTPDRRTRSSEKFWGYMCVETVQATMKSQDYRGILERTALISVRKIMVSVTGPGSCNRTMIQKTPLQTPKNL